MSYVCEAIQIIEGVQTCVMWVESVEPELNLLKISDAEANLLLSQVALCFATVYVYNVINKMFQGN